MPKTRRITTNWSKGELSPLVDGQTDLAAYYEGARIIENFLLLRQGGLRRRSGTRMLAEVKDSNSDTILIPFERSVSDAYVLEAGDQYFRFYKDKSQIQSAGMPVELTTPYFDTEHRSIHFTQSADVLFLFHSLYQQREVAGQSDTSWSISLFRADPPPSFEADTNLGVTLAIGANTGTGLEFRVSGAVLLAADAGRQILSGAGRAAILTIVPNSSGTCDILDDFNQTITAGPAVTSTVAAAWTSVAHGLAVGDYVVMTSGPQTGELRRITVIGSADTATLDAAFSVDQVAQTWNKILATDPASWNLHLSPQTTLDPTIRAPIGATVTLAAGANAFRAADVGKFIRIYGGIVKITVVTAANSVKGTLLSVMGDTTDANPAAAPAGAWQLEVASWSASRGWPRTGEFFQGRLYQASTVNEPVTIWGSASDDFPNYAIGVTAEDAVNYPVVTRQVNQIEWLADNRFLFFGTSGSEHRMTGSGSDNAVLGGDVVPLVERLSIEGCAGIQPVQIARQIIYVDRSRRKILAMNFDLETDGFRPRELTVGAEHITESGVRLGPMALEKRLDARVYFTREDGEQAAMTFFPEQKVVGFSRIVTGFIESQAIIPNPNGGRDRIYLVVRRTIDGVTRRFVELVEDDHEELAGRAWTSLQTDCAIVYNGVPATSIPAAHLEGQTVQVVAGHNYIGEQVVAGGVVTLEDAATMVEIGIPYTSTMESMRPAIQGEVIEGLPRSWNSLFVRLHNSWGGKVNGNVIAYPPGPLDTIELFTGDRKVNARGVDTDGRVTILQDEPYPFTALAMFGSLSLGDHD